MLCGSHMLAGSPIDEDGNIVGQDSGSTLLRRIIGLYPKADLIWGDRVIETPWGRVIPLKKVDVNNTVVISFDVLETPKLFLDMKLTPGFHHPKVLNFAWWNAPEFSTPVRREVFSISMALFPVIGNSPKVIQESKDLIRKHLGVKMLGQMRTAWTFLGVDVEKIPTERREEQIPVVQYPAMFMTMRKNPEQFLKICAAVRRRTPLNARMRLHKSGIKADVLESVKDETWVQVMAVPPSKQQYYDMLPTETAFLATSSDESYGIGFLESLYAGLIGIFPDKPWCKQILPPGYPFLFRTDEEAEEMLYLALTRPEWARAQVDAVAGGSVQDWIRENHNAADFDREFVRLVEEFYPERVVDPNAKKAVRKRKADSSLFEEMTK
ncbi:glycosyltransferase [Arthrobacter phage DanielleIgnace]|nr:glycosyltransferase [Arthrobacter phage DanielleIgnace]